MSIPNVIRWFVKASFDDPQLRSPQPCARGIYCDYRRWNPVSKQMEPAVCHFVHPGEEGTGRRLFPARQLKETGAEATFREQPACVRLTGAAQGFYERCGRRIPWGTWCAQKGIPYTPLAPGAAWEPVTIERIGGPRTPQRPRAERPPPMAPKRSSSGGGGGGGATLNFWEWAATASAEEMEEYSRHYAEDTGPDCDYCDPSSGCDGDHGDEMRDGFIVRKPARALNYAVEEPDANGRLWYDSRTPVGAIAQALMACEKLEKSWHPALKELVEESTPEELAAGLGPADVANIENSPFHYATHLLGRARREKHAKRLREPRALPQNLESLLSAMGSAATNEELNHLEKQLSALVDN